jgi:hypothetical protein
MGWMVNVTPRATLPPEKRIGLPLCRRLGGPQNRSGRMRKISPQPGFDAQTFQPVASRYTDWAIPARAKREMSPINSTEKTIVSSLQLFNQLILTSRFTFKTIKFHKLSSKFKNMFLK